VTDTVRYEAADGVAVVTLNRAERLNAMNGELLDGLVDRLEQAAADEEIRAVVLTGAGRAFCVGGDLAAMAEAGQASAGGTTQDEQVAVLQRQQRASLLLRQMPKATIAAVNGACAGAGFSLACAADVRFAASSAVFRTAFLSAGLSGDFGGSWTLPRIVGDARARELYLLNEKVPAERAAAIGLVADVLPDDALLGHARDVAHRLAAAPPLTLAAIKRNLADHAARSFEDALASEARAHIATAHTADAAEAWQAFAEKRRPTFKGR
jgi:2-(1,2-epoxy-1,2-dihydrophenyl)acetyl-CoA isomerase